MDNAQQKDYLIVGAIDFGTTFSGYAFSTKHDFLKDPRKLGNISIKHWADPISTMTYNKTSTCILFTEERIFDKFGFEAEAKYLDLILDNDHENWYFFRRFKMSLYAIQVQCLFHSNHLVSSIIIYELFFAYDLRPFLV